MKTARPKLKDRGTNPKPPYNFTKENAAEMGRKGGLAGKGQPKGAEGILARTLKVLAEKAGKKDYDNMEDLIRYVMKHRPETMFRIVMEYTEKKPTQEVSATLNTRVAILEELKRIEAEDKGNPRPDGLPTPE